MAGTTYPAQAYPGQYYPGSPAVTTVKAGLLCEVAFTSSPSATSPLWHDITKYVMELQIKRGRQKELDRIDAGTCTLRLNNSDRRFDPTHTGSPWYPYVLPMRRIRIRWIGNEEIGYGLGAYGSGPYGGGATDVVHNLFSGFVEAWPQTWEGPHVGFSEINATDAFLPLSKADIGTGEEWPTELSGARVNRVLDAVGWPTDDRNIDNGKSEIIGATFPLGSGTTALGHIDEIADTELGTFFVDGQGRAVFHDRHHRRATSYLTSQATLGDALSGGLPYQTVVLDTDAARIWNDVQVTATGGETQQVQDTNSRISYLRRTLARSVPLARDTEAADQAAFLLSFYKEPRNRFASIEITPTTNALWAQALGRELSDHITVKRWPQGVGSQIVQECSIEAIEHRAQPGFFKTRWLLSTPAYTAVNWWLLGNATYGKLGTTTRLIY